jgi:hypothetical protein
MIHVIGIPLSSSPQPRPADLHYQFAIFKSRTHLQAARQPTNQSPQHTHTPGIMPRKEALT